MKEIEMVEAKKLETKKAPDVPAHLSSTPKPRQNTEYDIPDNEKAKPTKEQVEAKKRQDEANKIEAAAAETAGKINANLIKGGDARRVQGGVRNGEPVFYWGNFIPTQAMTEEELKAAQGMTG